MDTKTTEWEAQWEKVKEELWSMAVIGQTMTVTERADVIGRVRALLHQSRTELMRKVVGVIPETFDSDFVSKHEPYKVSAHWGSLTFCQRCGRYAEDGDLDMEEVCCTYVLGRLTSNKDDCSALIKLAEEEGLRIE